MDAEREDGRARGAPRAQDQGAPGRRPRGCRDAGARLLDERGRSREANELGGQRGRVRVVRHEPAVAGADERVGRAGHPRALVERVDQRQHALLVRHRHVEPVVDAGSQLGDDAGELVGRGAHRLVGVRQAERAHRRALHHRALRVPDRVPDDREPPRLQGRFPAAGSSGTGSMGSTLSTRASRRAARTRRWNFSPGATSSAVRIARPSSRVAMA